MLQVTSRIALPGSSNIPMCTLESNGSTGDHHARWLRSTLLIGTRRSRTPRRRGRGTTEGCAASAPLTVSGIAGEHRWDVWWNAFLHAERKHGVAATVDAEHDRYEASGLKGRRHVEALHIRSSWRSRATSRSASYGTPDSLERVTTALRAIYRKASHSTFRILARRMIP